MRVLVTGGAGFIGSHLTDAFLEAGHEVLVLDDLSSGKREHVPAAAKLVQLDIRTPEVREVFASFGPDVLCHHAAQMDVRKSVADPAFDADVNVVGTLKILELCREHGTKRVLFASTGGAIYGEQDVHPATEEHATRPVSPYGVAKLSVEGYLHFYAVEYGFAATCLRYANVYGPRQNPHGEAGVVAIFCQKLLSGNVPTIYGMGAQTRDFVYVGDVVQANILALEKGLTGSYNVGTGIETSVNDLYEAIRAACGHDGPAQRAAARPGEQLRSSLDASKLERATGWRPRTPLTEGLGKTVEYFRSMTRS
jgi:UDP-glucose 4-epimerase